MSRFSLPLAVGVIPRGRECSGTPSLTKSRHLSASGVLHRPRTDCEYLQFPCRVGGRIEKERVHVELFELLVIRSPYLYRRTSDLPYFTADFPPIFFLADRAANSVPRSCKVLL